MAQACVQKREMKDGNMKLCGFIGFRLTNGMFRCNIKSKFGINAKCRKSIKINQDEEDVRYSSNS